MSLASYCETLPEPRLDLSAKIARVQTYIAQKCSTSSAKDTALQALATIQTALKIPREAQLYAALSEAFISNMLVEVNEAHEIASPLYILEFFGGKAMDLFIVVLLALSEVRGGFEQLCYLNFDLDPGIPGAQNITIDLSSDSMFLLTHLQTLPMGYPMGIMMRGPIAPVISADEDTATAPPCCKLNSFYATTLPALSAGRSVAWQILTHYRSEAERIGTALEADPLRMNLQSFPFEDETEEPETLLSFTTGPILIARPASAAYSSTSALTPSPDKL